VKKQSLKVEFKKHAGRMKPHAPFDLDAEVAQAYEDFPELKGNTYFIDTGSGRLVHPRATQKMRDRVMNHPRIAEEIKISARKKASYGLIRGQGVDFNAVFLYLEEDSANLGVGAASYTEGQTKRALFDHELGHALTLRTKRAAAKYAHAPLLRETMAENFSLLRQFQRYGSRNKSIKAETRVDMSAAYFIFGSFSNDNHLVNDHYFVSHSAEQLIALNKRFDVSSLSPRETVQVAALTALKYTPGEATLDSIREELYVGGLDYVLPTLAARVLKTESTEAFKWGSKALRYVMGPDYTRDRDTEDFQRQEWPKVKKALDKKEARLRGAE
jgi:hypothetical protein